MLVPTYLLIRAGLLVVQTTERDRVLLRKLPLIVFQAFVHGVGMLQCLGLTTYARGLALRPNEPGLLSLPYASFVDWGSRIAISSFMMSLLWSACIMAVDYDTTLIPMDAAPTGWLDKLQTPRVRQFLVQARSCAVILLYIVHVLLCLNILLMQKESPEWNTAYTGLYAEEWGVVIIDLLLTAPHVLVCANIVISAKPPWLSWLGGTCAEPCSFMQPLTALLSVRCLQRRVLGQLIDESDSLAFLGPYLVALMVIGLIAEFFADHSRQSPLTVEDGLSKALLCLIVAGTSDWIIPKEGKSLFIWGVVGAVVITILSMLALRVRELRVLILEEPPLSEFYVLSQNPVKELPNKWWKRLVCGAAAAMVVLVFRAPSIVPSETATPDPHYYNEDHYQDHHDPYEDDHPHYHSDYDYSLYEVGHNDTLALQLLQNDTILHDRSAFWVSMDAEDKLKRNISSVVGLTEQHVVLWDMHLQQNLILFYVFNDTANGVKEKWTAAVQDTGSELHKHFLLNSTFPAAIDQTLCNTPSKYKWRPDENATAVEAACSLWEVNQYHHHHYSGEYDDEGYDDEDYERFHNGEYDDEEYAGHNEFQGEDRDPDGDSEEGESTKPASEVGEKLERGDEEVRL